MVKSPREVTMGTLARCIRHDLEHLEVLALLFARTFVTGSPYRVRDPVRRVAQ